MGKKKRKKDAFVDIDINEIFVNEKEGEGVENDEGAIGGAAFFKNNRKLAHERGALRVARNDEFEIISRWEKRGENEDNLLDEILILMNTEQGLDESEYVTEEHEWEAEWIRQQMNMNMETGENLKELLNPLTSYIATSKDTQVNAREAGKAGKNVGPLDKALKEHARVLNFNTNKRLVYRWFYYKNGDYIPYGAKGQPAIVEGDYVTSRQFMSTSSHKRFVQGEENNKRIVGDETGPRTFVKLAIITRYGVPIGNAVFKSKGSKYVEAQLHGSNYMKKNGGKELKKRQRQVEVEQKKLDTVAAKLKEKAGELDKKNNYNKTKRSFLPKKWTQSLSLLVEALEKERDVLKEKLEEVKRNYIEHRGNMVGQAEVLMNRWSVLEVKKINQVTVTEDNVDYTDYEIILEETDQVPTDADRPIKEIFTGEDSKRQRRDSLDFDAIPVMNQLNDIYKIPVDVPVTLDSLAAGQIDKLKELLDAKQIVIAAADRDEVRKALEEADKKMLSTFTISRNASALVIVKLPEKPSEDGDESSGKEALNENEKLKKRKPGAFEKLRGLFKIGVSGRSPLPEKGAKEKNPPAENGWRNWPIPFRGKSRKNKKDKPKSIHAATNDELEVHDFFTVKKTTGDGNCLFHAVSGALKERSNIEKSHIELREEVAAFYRNDKENLWQEFRNEDINYGFSMSEGTRIFDNFDDYINNMAKPGTWGSEIEICALSRMLGVNIIVFINDNGLETIGLTKTKKFTPDGTKQGAYVTITGNDLEDGNTLFIKNSNGNHFELLVRK